MNFSSVKFSDSGVCGAVRVGHQWNFGSSIDRFSWSGEIFHGGLAAKSAVTKKAHKLAQLQLDNDLRVVQRHQVRFQ